MKNWPRAPRQPPGSTASISGKLPTKDFAPGSNPNIGQTLTITKLPSTLAKGHYYVVVELTDPGGSRTVAASSAGIGVK